MDSEQYHDLLDMVNRATDIARDAQSALSAHLQVCNERHLRINENVLALRKMAESQGDMLSRILIGVVGGLFTALAAVALEIARAKGVFQ